MRWNGCTYFESQIFWKCLLIELADSKVPYVFIEISENVSGNTAALDFRWLYFAKILIKFDSLVG